MKTAIWLSFEEVARIHKAMDEDHVKSLLSPHHNSRRLNVRYRRVCKEIAVSYGFSKDGVYGKTIGNQLSIKDKSIS